MHINVGTMLYKGLIDYLLMLNIWFIVCRYYKVLPKLVYITLSILYIVYFVYLYIIIVLSVSCLALRSFWHLNKFLECTNVPGNKAILILILNAYYNKNAMQ